MEFKPLENERWVWIKTPKDDYSHYLVSDMGRCWNCKTNRYLNGSYKGKDGHCQIELNINGDRVTKHIHRLVADTFIPIPEEYNDVPVDDLVVHHLDENTHNNRVDNLIWMSRGEHSVLHNIGAKRRLGMHNTTEHNKKISDALKGDKCYLYGRYGKNHSRSKPILQYTKDGVLLKEWDCAADVQRELGIHHNNISACARGRIPSAGGYLWRYK